MRYSLLAILLALIVVGCDCEDEFETYPIGQGAIQAPPAAATGTAVDDTYDAIINTALNVNAASGVLSNDTANGNVTAAQNPSAQGGTVAVAADGSLTYAPATGFAGVDTFTYTVQYPGNQSQATVTIRVLPAALFVDNTAPAGGNGSMASPFNTLGGALAAANLGDTIFVFRGDGTNMGLTGPFTLQDGQRLIGEGVGLNGLAPGLGAPGGFPMLTGPITMRNQNTLRGLRISASPGNAVVLNQTGTFQIATAGGTISDNQFVNNVGNSIVALAAVGTWNIRNNTASGGPGFLNVPGILAAGTTNYVIEGNTMTDVQVAVSIIASGLTTVRVRVFNNTLTGAAAANSFDFQVTGMIDNSSLCVDIEGNSTPTAYRFRQENPSVLNVEQFAQFTTLNTGTLAPVVGTVTDVADGFCGF